MTQIQKFMLPSASHLKRHRNPILRVFSFCCAPSGRLAVVWLICAAGMILVVNIQKVGLEGSTAVVSNNVRGRGRGPGRDDSSSGIAAAQGRGPTVVMRNLPWLPDDPMPTIDAEDHHPLNLSAMDEWASTPLVGSYVHRLVEDDFITRIHMPFMDLQSKHRGKTPTFFGGRGKELPIQLHMTYNQTFASPDCVVLTRKGNKFAGSGVKVNQDRIAISDYVASDGRVEDFWMGLFDGHGSLGHVISHYAISEFPKRLEALRNDATLINDIEATKAALKDIFLAVNDNMPKIEGAGSTAISIWKRHDQLFISNVGDSKAFVVSVDRSRSRNAAVQVVYTTKPHKPNDPLERQRIESMGGEVQEPPAPGYSARLLIPMGGGDLIGLAMSRSLGDFEGHPYGLLAEPTTDAISVMSLDPGLDYLVILASDGLLDRVTELEIARQMAASQLLTPNGKYLPLEAAEQLILQSSHSWMEDPNGDSYRDDISLAVHRLRI
jgi:serine/threonine protein phosphatase PrpC